MQKQLIEELEQRIEQFEKEIEIREAAKKIQDDEILKCRERILELEDDKKALVDLVKKGVEPLIHERQSKKKEKDNEFDE